MKKKIQSLLQKIMGVENYLYSFARFRIFFRKAYTYEDDFPKFMNIIKEGTIIDIGANVGMTTVPLAKKFPNAQIHAFEPVPTNCAVLKRIIKHYRLNNVVVHETALGDEKGAIKMVVPVLKKVRMFGLSHAYVKGRDDDWNNGEIYKVPVVKLDDLADLRKEPRITAVKIDVENFEYFVLKGGRQLLQQHKPVIYCELWDNEMLDPVVELMKAIGYDVMVFEGKKLTYFTSQPVTNYIFVHKDEAFAV